MSVCGFKKDLGQKGLGGGTSGMKENCGVQKVDLCRVQSVFDFDGRMMGVECVDEIKKIDGCRVAKYL